MFHGRLHPIFLMASGSVQRAIGVPCPVCRERPGQPCKVMEGKPAVHDARESLAYHGKKIWA